VTYAAETAKPNNKPNYFWRFDDIASEQYVMLPVLAPTRTQVHCLELPESTVATLERLQNSTTYGEVRLRFIDEDQKLTDIFSTEQATPVVPSNVNMRGTLYGGYRDDPESEYRKLFTGELRKTHFDSGARTWECTVDSLLRKWGDLIMLGTEQAETFKLAAVPALGQTFLILNNELEFYSGTALLYRKDGSQYEKLTITGGDRPTKRVNLSTGITQSWSDLNNDIFTRAPFVRGNIINIFYALLSGVFERIYEPATATAATTDFSVVDFWNGPSGLGIPAADVDVPGFQFTRDALYANFDVDFLWRDAAKARQFFQAQLFLLGFFPYIRSDGKISVRAFVPPGPEVASPVTLAPQDMITSPKWKRLIDSHFNRVIVRGDVPVESGSAYADLALRENIPDQTNSKEVSIVEINSGGLRTALNGIALAQEIAARHLRRWQGPPIEVDVELALTKRDVEVGNVVSLTDPDLPDTTVGTRGLTDRLMEVIRAGVDYGQGAVDLTLFDHSFRRKWSWIAPDGTPDYGAASLTQKRYAFFGNASNLIGGAPGYYLY
jgi:hypothetical protein